MNTVKEIILIKGFEHLKENYIKIENPPYMPLTIERLPDDSQGNILVSVCHYGLQNGYAMRDPEMVFRIVNQKERKYNKKLFKYEEEKKEKWLPVYFRNDYAGIENDVIEKMDRVLVTGNFEKIWDKNILNQGFLKAYKDSLEKVIEYPKKFIHLTGSNLLIEHRIDTSLTE